MPGLILPNRPSPGVLVTPGGVPIVPESVQQEIAALTNGRGRVEWIAGAWKPYFGLKVRWRGEDPRWDEVRQGRFPAHMAFDLEKMFPEDCPTGEMVGYVRSQWGDRATPVDAAAEAERIVNASVKAQQDAQTENVNTLVERGTQQHLSESAHLRRVRAGAESAHPMVSGGLSR